MVDTMRLIRLHVNSALLMLVLLAGCDSLHPLVYNMTSCSIEVTYSAANIKNNRVCLPPGKFAGSIGIVSPRAEGLTVIDSLGVNHAYSPDDLSKLPPPG